jgi:hypothetical protein
LSGPAGERNLIEMEALAMQANSTGSVIGSMVLVGAVAGSIAICVRLTGRPSSDGGAPMSRWGRAAITTVVTLVVGAVAAGVLGAVGLGVKDEVDATTDLRDTLAEGGYTPAQVACVEARVVREYGSVDAIEDAADVKPVFVAIFSCNPAVGGDPAIVDCWSDAVVDHFHLERFDADALVDLQDDLGDPDGRQFVAVASLTCQGLSEEVATCIYTTAVAADPDIVSDRHLGQTPEQERILVDAARECGGG